MSIRGVFRLALGGAVFLSGVLGGGATASAHAELEGSVPVYGAQLASPPKEIRLRFTEPLELAGANLDLSSATGKRLRAGRPSFDGTDKRSLVARLPSLSAGTFTFSYWLLARDGHEMGGEVLFEVSALSDVEAARSPDKDPTAELAATPRAVVAPEKAQPVAPRAWRRSPGTGKVAVRTLSYLSLAVLLGGTAFLALGWPEGARQARLRRLLWLALGGALVTNLSAIALQGATIRRVPALQGFSPASLGAALDTRFGQALTAHGLILLLAIPLLFTLHSDGATCLRSRRFRVFGALIAVGALGARSLTGHASARGVIGPVINVVHFAAVSLWLGGLGVLAVGMAAKRQPSGLPSAVARFSQLALGAVATMLAGGVLLLLTVAPNWTELPSTPYGRAVLLKIALIALLLVAAQKSRRWVQHRLIPSAAGGPTSLSPLLASVGTELLFAIAVLAIAAELAGRAPPA